MFNHPTTGVLVVKRFCFVFCLFISTSVQASLTVTCRLYEAYIRPENLKLLATYPSAPIKLQRLSSNILKKEDLNLPISRGHDLTATLSFTEVEHANGVVWGVRTTTLAGPGRMRTTSQSCASRGVTYHFFVDRGRLLALSCKINSIAKDPPEPLDRKRELLLNGSPAEVCIWGGTSSTSGNWIR